MKKKTLDLVLGGPGRNPGLRGWLIWPFWVYSWFRWVTLNLTANLDSVQNFGFFVCVTCKGGVLPLIIFDCFLGVVFRKINFFLRAKDARLTSSRIVHKSILQFQSYRGTGPNGLCAPWAAGTNPPKIWILASEVNIVCTGPKARISNLISKQPQLSPLWSYRGVLIFWGHFPRGRLKRASNAPYSTSYNYKIG